MTTVETIAERTSEVFRHYGVQKAAVFGSYARGDARPDSDVDILVSFSEHTPSLWEFAALRTALMERLGMSVDLVSERALLDQLRSSITEDMQTIYEQK